MVPALTNVEQDRLTVLEATVYLYRTTKLEAGKALEAIRDEKLYENIDETFEGYCQKRWGYTRQRAYQLIDGANVVEAVSTIVDIPPPHNEAQARELGKLDTVEEQSDLWNSTVQKTGKAQPTASEVAEVRREMHPEHTPSKKQVEHELRKKGIAAVGVLVRTFDDLKAPEDENFWTYLEYMNAWLKVNWGAKK